MKKTFISIISLIFILIAGCSKPIKYDDKEVAAVVRGEEITIGDLRFLYADDDILEMIEGEVKAVLIVQEAKRMNLDIEEDLEVYTHINEYPPENAQSSWAESTREFAEKQAKKLGMTPEQYFKEHQVVTSERNAYISAYVLEMLEIPDDFEEKDAEEFNEKANQLLDNLMLKNKDRIDIRIK